MVSFSFDFNNKDPITNPPTQSTTTLISTSTNFQLDPIHTDLPPAPPSRPDSRPDSPATPPPTPLSASQLLQTELESSQLMLELTRAKLERAAQGQLTGRRAAGLRELVLLSNAFVGALTPDWNRREHDRQVAEQRKLEEERWLDGILEEMSVEDEDDEDEAYVEISYVDEREAHDSGYLDHEDDARALKASTSALEAVNEDGDLRSSLDSIEYDYRDGREEVDPTRLGQDPVVTHPPGPSKSPPIPVPPSPTRPNPIIHSSCDDCASASPPQDPPPLTPDCSPRDEPSELLGSSLDSFELPDRFGLDKLDWLHHPGHKRLGLFTVPSSPPSGSDRPLLAKLELDSDECDALALEPFGRGTSQEEDDAFADRMLRTSLVPRSATASPSPQWVAPTPTRSLSLPPPARERNDRSTPHPIPSFQSGIVTLWDCVDFGRHAPPIPYFASTAAGGSERAKSLPSSPERGRGAIEAGQAHAQVQAGEMAVRPLPEFPPLVVAGEEDRMGRSPWRARSMSPEVSGRRGWASLGGLSE